MKNSPDTRNSLIARLSRSEDAEAWEEFVELYQPVIERFVARRGLQYNDAAEVTQEVLTKVAMRVDSWDPNGPNASFRGWLYRVTRNTTLDYLQKMNRVAHKDAINGNEPLAQLVDPGSEKSDKFYLEFERQLFHHAAGRIRGEFQPRNWQAFWLSMVVGMSIADVAKKLEVTPGTVHVARSRIVARLRREIQERLNETG